MTSPMGLINLLKGHKTYIQTHNFPDPDAMASAYGLQQFLKLHGIDTILCYDGQIEKLSTKRMIETFQMDISQKDLLKDIKKDDYIITIDAQKYNTNLTDLIGNEIACIDHHPTYIECEYKYKDVRMVGACASIIVSYFKETQTEMSPMVASALVYGMKMDTADFTRGTTDFDIDMFAYAYKKADLERLNSMYLNVMEFNDLKAYAAAIEDIEVYDKIGFAGIPFDCSDALIAIISDFILALEEVEVSVIYSIRKDGIKFSVRSEIPNVDAGKLVSGALDGIGSGGGHKEMAGGFIPNDHSGRSQHDIHYAIRNLFLLQMKKIR